MPTPVPSQCDGIYGQCYLLDTPNIFSSFSLEQLLLCSITFLPKYFVLFEHPSQASSLLHVNANLKHAFLKITMRSPANKSLTLDPPLRDVPINCLLALWWLKTVALAHIQQWRRRIMQQSSPNEAVAYLWTQTSSRFPTTTKKSPFSYMKITHLGVVETSYSFISNIRDLSVYVVSSLVYGSVRSRIQGQSE